MIAGNKGEWSELYVLIRLLADGRLYSADSDLKKMDNVYLPIRIPKRFGVGPYRIQN